MPTGAEREPPQAIKDDAKPPPPAEPPSESDRAAEPGLMEALEEIPVALASEHPHRKLEDLIKDHLKRCCLLVF